MEGSGFVPAYDVFGPGWFALDQATDPVVNPDTGLPIKPVNQSVLRGVARSGKNPPSVWDNDLPDYTNTPEGVIVFPEGVNNSRDFTNHPRNRPYVYKDMLPGPLQIPWPPDRRYLYQPPFNYNPEKPSTVPPRQQPRSGGLQPSGGGGLLDSLYNKQGMTPLGMGLLSGFASLLASSGYKPYPRSIGAQLGQGLLGGLQGYSGQQAYLDRRQQALEKAQRERLMLGLQMEQYVRSQQQQEALNQAYPELLRQIPNEKARNYLEKLPPQLGLKIIQDNAKSLFPFSKSEVTRREDGVIIEQGPGGQKYVGYAPTNVEVLDRQAKIDALPGMLAQIESQEAKAFLERLPAEVAYDYIKQNPSTFIPKVFPPNRVESRDGSLLNVGPSGETYAGPAPKDTVIPIAGGVATVDANDGEVSFKQTPWGNAVKAPTTRKGSELGQGFQPNAYYMQNKQGTWDLINPEEFNQRRALSKDYTSETAEHSKVAKSWKAIVDTNNDPNKKTGMSDQVLITNFKKILDPTSAVMQGEFDSVSNMMGFLQKVEGTYGKMEEGTRLTDTVRKDLQDAILIAVRAYAQDAKEKKEIYRKKAERFNYNDMEFVDSFEGMDFSSVGGRTASSNRTADDYEKFFLRERQ